MNQVKLGGNQTLLRSEEEGSPKVLSCSLCSGPGCPRGCTPGLAGLHTGVLQRESG